MENRTSLFIAILFFTLYAFGQTTKSNSEYFGQEPPGSTPELFAPGTISTENGYEFGSVFSEAADELYYAVRLNEDWKAEIRYSKFLDGKWTKPVRLALDKKYGYNDPFLFKDDKLYFMSDRPVIKGKSAKDSDLWYLEKTQDGWSEPINLGKPINSDKNEYYISFSDAGTLYFSSNVHTSKENESDYDIYAAKDSSENFENPVRLGPAVNSEYFEVDAFVAPDGSYLIFCSTRPNGFGEGDLYISFKKEDNTWGKALNMGEIINTKKHEFCPFVSRDGNYLFYTSNGNIYWVSAEIIENLK